MKGFNSEFIDQIKLKNDIVDVVGRYVTLERKGNNFWGRCPFHHEKTASFTVNLTGQFFYCFGCHKSGDVISFIMEIESLDFADAVKFLAERAKIPLPEIKYDDDKIKEQKKKKERVLALLKDTAYFYVSNLRSGRAKKHTDYIAKRGISPQTVTKFGLGASLNFEDLPEYLLKKGYTYEEMLESGAVDVSKGRYYDSLGGRFIVPIIDQFNQVVAFGGRLLEKADFAKYKNTKETVAFSKSYILYNINNLKKIKNEKGIDSVIIVEGYMDTISLVQAGIENVVASMGTSLTKDQARILKRYTERVYISYDGDSAGQNASIRGLEILKNEGLDVKVVALPEDMDPDDVVKAMGAEGYNKLLSEAKPLIDFKLDLVRKKYDIKSVDGRRKYVSEAISVIRESPSATEQEDLLKTVRDVTGVTIDALKRDLYKEDTEKPVATQNFEPTFNDNVGDKNVMAARFVLYAYLFKKKYTEEQDIEDIDFTITEHDTIKDYLINCKKSGKEIRFNDLFEIFPRGDAHEVSKIGELETDENKRFDEVQYFADCLKTLKINKINSEIDRINSLFKSKTDVEQRKMLAKELSRLLSEKNKIS